MSYQISNIHLSIEKIGLKSIDYTNENTDVIVELEKGEIYVASFFTYKYLERLRQQHIEDGNFLSGKYFWAELMVIVEDCSLKTVKRVVKHLINEGDFEEVFRRL